MMHHSIRLACCAIGMWYHAIVCAATPIMEWNEAIAWYRDVHQAEARQSGAALYIGRRSHRFVRMVEHGMIDTAGLPLIVLSADIDALNPMTDQTVLGRDIIRQFSTLSQTNPAGSVFLLDELGIVRPLLTMHHAVHRNQPDRLNLMFAYAASGMTDAMSLEEFARLRGEGPLIMQMAQEIRTGHLTEASLLVLHYFAQEIDPDTAIVGTAPDGSAVPTGTTVGRIFLLTDDPAAPAFLAQARDIWEKLTIGGDGMVTRPPLTVVGPPGSSYELLALQGIAHETVSAPVRRLRDGPLPRMILSGGEGGVVVEVRGFVPGDILGSLLGVHVPDRTPLHPDMPLGETDSLPTDFTSPAP